MVDRLTKFLRKQPDDLRRLVLALIDGILSGQLKDGDVKKLKGKQSLYRLRKGRIRIIFEKRPEGFFVKKVTLRDDNTYSDL
jgi:mRNA-degrading endonuclease RelE of RelBE toxin-antitoxin system